MVLSPPLTGPPPSKAGSFVLRPLVTADADKTADLIRAAFAAQSRPTLPPSSALRETGESVASKIAGGGGFGVLEAGRARRGCAVAPRWRQVARRSRLGRARSAWPRPRADADRRLRGGGAAARPPANDPQNAARTARERAIVRTFRLRPARRRGASWFDAPTTAVMEKLARMTGVATSFSAPRGASRSTLARSQTIGARLRARAAPGRCAAVVKANAYGIGLAEAAPALWAAGARVFFVAHLSEGVAARQVLPGGRDLRAQRPRERAQTRRTMRAIASRRSSAAKRSLSAGPPSPRGAGRTSPCALHLDTGMNRLGFESLARLRAAMEAHGAASGADLLMSHFVSSEFADDPINAAQIERFDAARAAFPSLPASLANSSGMFLARARSTTWPGRAMRSMAAIRRRARQPDAPGRDARRRHPADPLDRGRHDLRLQRPVDRQAPHAACDPARRLRRRPAARRRRDG